MLTVNEKFALSTIVLATVNWLVIPNNIFNTKSLIALSSVISEVYISLYFQLSSHKPFFNCLDGHSMRAHLITSLGIFCPTPSMQFFCSIILYYQAKWCYSGSCTDLIAGFYTKGRTVHLFDEHQSKYISFFLGAF